MNNNSLFLNMCQTKINNMNIRIKKIRQILNMSQQQYAEMMRTSQSNISKYERGELKPTLDFLVNLHTELNIDINWVLTGKGSVFISADEKQIDKTVINQAIELLKKAVSED